LLFTEAIQIVRKVGTQIVVRESQESPHFNVALSNDSISYLPRFLEVWCRQTSCRETDAPEACKGVRRVDIGVARNSTWA
jgi:hypothetical protein